MIVMFLCGPIERKLNLISSQTLFLSTLINEVYYYRQFCAISARLISKFSWFWWHVLGGMLSLRAKAMSDYFQPFLSLSSGVFCFDRVTSSALISTHLCSFIRVLFAREILFKTYYGQLSLSLPTIFVIKSNINFVESVNQFNITPCYTDGALLSSRVGVSNAAQPKFAFHLPVMLIFPWKSSTSSWWVSEALNVPHLNAPVFSVSTVF